LQLPAAGARGGDELVAGGWNLAPTWAGEEVKILGRSSREVLCRQRCATGKKESLGCGQLKEHCRCLQLEARQRGGQVGIAH